jgi:hypothetical protein
MSCCTELTACFADTDCACVATCSLGGGDIQTCFQMCGVTTPPMGAIPLAQCVQGMCGMDCMMP